MKTPSEPPYGEPETRVRLSSFVVRGGTLSDHDGRSVEVGHEPVTVGRDPSASLPVADPEVSALHVELQATPRGVVLRDLDSTNGTWLGPAAVREARLVGPCTIRVGQTDLTFVPASRAAPVETDAASSFGPLLGQSTPMRRVFSILRRVAPTELSTLVMGETGTGKELVAQALHDASERVAGPFVVLDCGSIPTQLAESILFGHEKGSFTGAIHRKTGVFQQAEGGTIFLDELGELAPELQPKMLRAIAERSVRRVGGQRYEPINVRIVAATRRDLRREVNAGHFRADLFFRIAQVTATLPPLRDRRDDIPALVACACERVGRAQAADAVTQILEFRFQHYDWPGNVRELVNVASVLASLEVRPGDSLFDALLPLESPSEGTPEPEGDQASAERFVDAKRSFEHRYFRNLQKLSNGNISAISRQCGLPRHQVRAHLRKLGLLP